jgi:D-alanyl-D-alanine carboxypeptidase
MFERFPKSSRRLVERARGQAAALGSRDLESVHLLLALAGDEDQVVRRVFSSASLDDVTLRSALIAQEEAALAAVGVSRIGFGLPSRAPLPHVSGWATSSKQALRRARTEAGARHARRIEPAHVLLGVLRAEAGDVPRTLAFAGADAAELALAAERALDATG